MNNKGLIFSDDGGPAFFSFNHLDAFPGITHAFFTRKGGVSKSPYASLDAGNGDTENESRVIENRNRILKISGGERLIPIHQVHGRKAVVYRGETGFTGSFADADALITDRPGAVLMIRTADCQPVLIYDPQKKVVAAIHSGWRGSVQNIIASTIEAMTAVFASSPADLYAGIGPSLGPCCAEFVNYREELPESFFSCKTGKNHFDFWEISRRQLLEKGVPDKNIRISGLCTRCNQDLFFSYRRDKITGRLANIIGINPFD